MNVATPHSLPDGDNSSAGMNASAAATTKACSVGVSVSSGSGAGATVTGCAAAGAGFAALAEVIPVATAVPATPAPHKNLRRGIVSSAMASLPGRGVARPLVVLVWKDRPKRAGTEGSMRGRAHASCGSAVNPGDRQKLFGFEARATNQRTVDVIDRHEFRRVARLHRAAIEDADLLRHLAIAQYQKLANEAVHIADVARCRGQSGADGPDRLVSDGKIRRAVRQRPLKLRTHHCAGAAGITLGARFADTDHGGKAGAPRGKRLVADRCVGLAVIVATFGMADDNGLRPGIFEHFGGNVARIGPGGSGMAVLGTDGDTRATRRGRKTGQQRRRWAHHHVDIGELFRPGDDLLQLARRGFETVHFPVACDQRAPRHRTSPKNATKSR